MPAAHVVPAEIVAGHANHVIRPLQHRIVDRNILAKRKNFGDASREVLVGKRRQAGEKSRGLREVQPQTIENGRGFPEEHTGVPVEVPGADELLRLFELRLLAELLDGNSFEFARRGALREFDIAVPGLRPAGRDAQHNDLVFFRRPKGRAHMVEKALRITDDVVGGENAEDGVGVNGFEDMGRESDGGGGVSLRRLRDDLMRGDVRQLTHNFIAHEFVGEAPDALGRNDRRAGARWCPG